MDALKASGVCRKYGKQEVLKDFSLAIEEGGFEALMGPSGSGKSTFLHLAAGLLAADSGDILIGGKDVVKMGDTEATKFRRRHVGVVFQSFNLLNEKTVRENVYLPVVLKSSKAVRDPEVASRFATLMKRLGLEGKEDRKPEELSGGEQQRVAIARALLAEPDVVLADEPTGNLDAKASKAICSLLGELDKTERSAILVVTHDPQVAAAARKVHFLKDGRIAASYDTEGDAERVSKLYLETYR
jgi:putative ABC transport system ATP-binding protein